jgi:hypothetical protein
MSVVKPRLAGRARFASKATALLAAALLLIAALACSAAQAKPSKEPFAVEDFHVAPSTLQAGAHEDLTVSFNFAHNNAFEGIGEPYNDVRTTIVELPPGFTGNNTAVPTCSQSELLTRRPGGSEFENLCPPASQVGTIAISLHLGLTPGVSRFDLYNMETTSPGIAAQLGFTSPIGAIMLPITVRPGDSGLTVTARDTTVLGEPHDITTVVWGRPAAAVHDPQRGQECGFVGTPSESCEGGGQSAEIPVKPFLAMPTNCSSQPPQATLRADSWEEPESWSEASTEIGPIVECERVHFDPSIQASPTTNAAESATGLNFSMEVPQTWELPETLSTSNLRDATVTLPEGMSLNPSAGSGLGSCTEEQFEAEGSEFIPGAGCPPESKVGTVEVETPVLTEHATGSVYVATPFQNPFHSLLALYIVAKIPSRGIVVKVAGEIHADPLTGQLTTTFKENPQVPFNKFTLKFNQGATSPLISPPACGAYTALADLTPWSAPLEPRHPTSTFPVETGVHGGPCPSGGLPPFHPLLHAGSYSNEAGAYTPFYIRLSRQDGEQEITHFSIKLPPGLVGKLAGIPLCSDAAIAQAQARTGPHGGEEEEQSPSCPAASQIGRTEVEAGVGGTLASAPGRVYLAGPYHGSAISVVAITDAKVGPFDLGTVVVREALKVNPETGEVFVDATGSDPIPHIVDGIPTHLRDIRVYMDKPEFVLNPTSCKQTSTASTVLGSGLSFASEADDQPITVTSPFQAANCAALPFKPKLKLSLIGGTKRGQNPKLRAVLTARAGDANIGRAQVTLPRSEFLDNAHIKTICTRTEFAQGNVPGEQCPAGSVYGFAKAVTPILSEPLQGPVYLRSSEHKLPDLVAALHSGEIDIALDGRIDSVKGQIRNTFETVPDAPVKTFTLEMQGAGKGLLENSTDLCAGAHRAIAGFTGHNGKVEDFRPVLKPLGCKAGKAHKGHKHKRPSR